VSSFGWRLSEFPKFSLRCIGPLTGNEKSRISADSLLIAALANQSPLSTACRRKRIICLPNEIFRDGCASHCWL
jgi:hypothetical protein